jgi:peptide/nickel transport system substrate-binding protein
MLFRRDVFRLVFAALLILSVFLTACTPEETEAPTEEPAVEEATPVEEATTAEEEEEEEAESTAEEETTAEEEMEEIEPVVVLQGVEATTLDPHFISNTPQMSILFHVFDTLTKVDIETGEVLPSMAESWELIDDTTWRFKLREDITFHNGEPFNAEVVKYNMDRLVDPEVNAYKWFFVGDADFESCEVVDEYTVDIHTASPSAVVADALHYTLIVPKEYYSTTPLEELASKPVGSGPYQITEWVPDDHMRLERWDDYWGEAPPIETVVFRPVPELSTRISELVTGGADIIVNVAPDQTGQIEDCEFCQVMGNSGGRDIYIMIDLRFKPFDDQRVRQAMNYAVDKQAILDAFFQGKGKIIAGVANGFWENKDLEPYPYDPEKALELFAEAGYTPGDDGKLQKDGETITVLMHTSNGRYMKDKEVAQAVAADLNEIGLDVTVEPLEWSVLSGNAYAGELAPLALRGLGGFFNGVGELRWITPAPQYSEEHDRDIRWQSSEFEEKYEQMKAEMDTAKRKEIADELQAMAYEACPWIFLYKQYDFYGAHDRIEGWQPRADEFVLMTDIASVDGNR